MSVDTARVRRTLPARAVPRVSRRTWRGPELEHLCAAGVLALVCAWLLVRVADPVSGSDGGNWLTLSGGLIGIRANAAHTVYPPGFLLVLLLARLVAPPVEALRLAAIGVALLPGLGAYLLLRSLGLRRLALIGACVPLLGYPSEMIAWGGYPQLMGSGLALLACAALAHGYATGQYPYFAAAGVCAGLAVATHQLAGLQAILAIAAASGFVLLVQPRAWWLRLRQWAVTGGVCALVVAPTIPTYLELVSRTGAGAFNAQQFISFGDMADYLSYDGPPVWQAAAVCLPIALLLRVARRAWRDLAMLIGLGVASLGLAMVTLEVRALFPTVLMVGVLAPALAVSDLARLSGPRWRRVLVASAGALWLTLFVAGQRRLESTTRYYAMLDPPMVDGLDWLAQHAHAGDVAASIGGHAQWPLGWWVQGLGHVPSYLDFDERWLYFQDEKRQAAIAHAILSNPDPQAAAAAAQQAGVTLLIFDARDPAQVNRWLQSGQVFGPIGLIYSNSSVAIFRVEPAGA